MKTKFKLLDGVIKLFGLTPQEAVAHFSKKIEMPTIIPAKKFVTPSLIETGMFHYSEENLIFPEIIPELTIDSVIGCWDKNSGLGLCRDERELPWSSDFLEVDKRNVTSGFEATQMILEEASKTGEKAEAAQYCANYARYGISKGQAFLLSRFEVEIIKQNIYKANEALDLLEAKLWGFSLWTSSEYSYSDSWYLGLNRNFCLYTDSSSKDDYYNVRPVINVTI